MVFGLASPIPIPFRRASRSIYDAAITHLQTVGIITVKTIVGENGGNEYEVFTPEEVAAGVFGLPILTGTTSQIDTTETTQILERYEVEKGQ